MTTTTPKTISGGVSTDARVRSVSALLTGPRLLAGEGEGVLRLPAICRILGTPLHHRGALIAWLKDRGLITDPDYIGPLELRPLAGTVEVAALRSALLEAIKAGPLPFGAVHLERANG